MSSSSIAFPPWIMIASAARTLVDGGVPGSTITLLNVETAAPDLVQLRDQLTFGRSARESDPQLTSKTGPNRVNVRNVGLSGYRHRAFVPYPSHWEVFGTTRKRSYLSLLSVEYRLARLELS